MSFNPVVHVFIQRKLNVVVVVLGGSVEVWDKVMFSDHATLNPGPTRTQTTAGRKQGEIMKQGAGQEERQTERGTQERR